MKLFRTYSFVYSLIVISIITLIGGCKKDKTEDTPPQPVVSSFTDSRDGNVYKTVKIGDQTWMAENLRYLPMVHGNDQFQGLGITSKPAYGVYGYDGTDLAAAKARPNYTVYGVLYNGFAIDSTNICPSGWHLATKTEWDALSSTLGGVNVAGGKLKESGTSHWFSPNVGATNESGFNGLPGGYRVSGDNSLGYSAYFWISPNSTNGSVWTCGLNNNDALLHFWQGAERMGYSVRCVKD